MSFRDGEMHTLAAIGACVLSVGLAGGLYASSGEAKAETTTGPVIEDMEAIEASIATRKKPAKLPQKQFKEPPPEPQVDKVSRTAQQMPENKEKPNEPKVDPNDPLKNVKRRPVDDDRPVGKPTEDVGDFNDNERGFADETKG